MAKNLMPRIAEMLGVEIGERFKVSQKDSEIYYFTDAAFLKQVNDAESEDFVSDLEEEDLLVLYYLLSGKETVVKLPWEPKEDEQYWTISFVKNHHPYVENYIWNSDDMDFLKLKLGMVYRTKAEAEAHLSEDYQRLTGKKLEG